MAAGKAFLIVLLLSATICCTSASPAGSNRMISVHSSEWNRLHWLEDGSNGPDMTAVSNQTPVLIWHGMGDTCCNPLSMGSIKRAIEELVPGIYVHSLMIGNNIIDDEIGGFLGNASAQVQEACDYINSDERLSNGYHAMGFSQGGQFLRALAQTCPNPPMKNLISFGGQHQGVYGFPRCDGNVTLCNIVRRMLNYGAYESIVQNNVIQAQYWHDPLDAHTYVEKSIFLAIINQERTVNEKYKENLLKLQNLVLVMFGRDTMVQPKESELFGFYANGNVSHIVPMEQSELYTQDKLGLKELNESGRLFQITLPGNHLEITQQELADIVHRFVADS